MNAFELADGQLNGIRFGRGPKILAMHGYLDHALSFKALSTFLPNYEIWSLDLPGHGLSAPLPKQDGTFILNWLPLLGRALDELAWPNYIILGHSMGAVLSQLLAAVDDRISQLISLDALGPIASTQDENFARYQKLYNARNKRFPIRYYSTYQELIQSRESGMFPLSATSARQMAKRAVGLADPGWYHRYDRQLRDESIWRLSEADAQAWLAKIKCPVSLALFNAHRWPTYAQVLDQRLSSVKNLTVTYLDGSHHLHMEAPERVASWVTTCIRQ